MALIETTDTPEDLERLLRLAREKLEAFEAAVDGKRLLARVQRASPAHPVLIMRGLFLFLGVLFIIGMFGVVAAGMFHPPSAELLYGIDRRLGIPGGMPAVFMLLALCMFVGNGTLTIAARYIGRESPMLPWEAKEHQKLVNEVTRLTTQKAVMERIKKTPGNARPRISTPVPMSMRGSQGGGGGFGGLAGRADSRPSYLADSVPSYGAPGGGGGGGGGGLGGGGGGGLGGGGGGGFGAPDRAPSAPAFGSGGGGGGGGFGAPGRAPSAPAFGGGGGGGGFGAPGRAPSAPAFGSGGGSGFGGGPPAAAPSPAPSFGGGAAGGGSLLDRARGGRPEASPSFGSNTDYGNDFGGAPSSGGPGFSPPDPAGSIPPPAVDSGFGGNQRRPSFGGGAPAFGQPQSPAPAFGQQPQAPAFGQQPAFGQPQAPAFGEQAPAFGSNPANEFGGTKSSPFGGGMGASTRGGTPLGAPPRSGVSLRQPSLTEPRFEAAPTPSYDTPSYAGTDDPGAFNLVDEEEEEEEEATAQMGIQMMVKKTALADAPTESGLDIGDIVETSAAKIVQADRPGAGTAQGVPKWGRIDEIWLEEAIERAEEMISNFPPQARLAFSVDRDLPFTLVIERATPAMAVRAMVSFVEFLAAIYTPKFARIQLIKVAHLDRSFHRNVDAALQPYFAGKVRVENNPGQIDILFSDPDPGWDEYPVLPME